ncbi:hypothetical protein B484DRAFT_449782 [Ochromonadaceae sp. CCMP2298]|nr:hypothetical protein B484DRAFT_449782 [Ochromonadaceae sp. CCMP2298]
MGESLCVEMSSYCAPASAPAPASASASAPASIPTIPTISITTTESKQSTPTHFPKPLRTHYVTYASDMNEELASLMLSANLSGVHLEVLGLGRPYLDYSSKTEAYFKYVNEYVSEYEGGAEGARRVRRVRDGDVVLLMDAYDVLLFPHIQRAALELSTAPSPIVFCAERGIYPEISLAHLYQRGAYSQVTPSYSTTSEGHPSSLGASYDSQKFLNSGCILGRGAQMRQLLAYTHTLARTVRDDQQIMVRYMLEHPEAVSLDAGNRLFKTNFKLNAANNDLSLTFDLTLSLSPAPNTPSDTDSSEASPPQPRPLGLLHCNNRNSGSAYAPLRNALYYYRSLYYSGTDAPSLLLAVQAIARGDFSLAGRLLNSPEVVSNCSSSGGSNPLRRYLLTRI